MSAFPISMPDVLQNYLVRLDKQTVVFAPINSIPHIKNFFLLETCEKYIYSTKEKKFVPNGAQGILYIKREESTQKLEGFKATNLSALLLKVGKRVSQHYAKLS